MNLLLFKNNIVWNKNLVFKFLLFVLMIFNSIVPSSPSLSPSPSPSPSPTNGCESEVERQIDEVKETPIGVETCLNGSKERIECCPDPFTFDDNDECVVECYQYLFGQSLEYWVRIISFVFTWFSLFAFVVAFTPLSLMTELR